MRWISLLLLLPSIALAGPETIHQEGVLMDARGVPYEGLTQVRFNLYTQAEEGVVLWFEEHNLNINKGYFSVLLGEQTALGTTLDADPRFLGVMVDGVEMQPRVQLSSVPYALRARDVVGDIMPDSIYIGDQQVIDETGNWVGPPVPGANDGVGYDTPAQALAGIKAADGEGSGLDADTLDGISSAAFVQNGDQVMALLLGSDGMRSGLDADRLDGHDSSAFVHTAAQLIELLITTDGADSGLDADFLDGHDSTEFINTTDPNTATQLLTLLLTVDGTGSGLDADLWDGHNSDVFLKAVDPATATLILNRLLTVDGEGSGIDADTLDGLHASKFMRVDQNTGTSGNLSVGGAFSGSGAQITDILVTNRVEAKEVRAKIIRLIPLDLPPDNPAEGAMYFDNPSEDIKFFNGSRWEPIGGFQVGSVFRNGSDGELVVAAANTVVNQYAYINANVAANTPTISVNDASSFSPGDEIFIIQTQEGNGNVYNAGTFEFRTVASKNGNNITLTQDLENAYGYNNPNSNIATIAQVVRVPQYTNVTINAGASITAPAWNGYTGGIVAFRATTTVNMTGSVNVNEKGFRGGEVGFQNNEPGWEGEGIRGKGLESLTGGGVTSPTGENNGGAGQRGVSHCGGGGGGGGHALQGALGETGDSYNDFAYGGYAVGSADLSTIHFGGGGGGGGDDDGHGTDAHGGHGAGIVFVSARNINNATVSSNGQSKSQNLGCGQAEGSGGAGGSVWLYAVDILINSVTANGGNGAGSIGSGSGWGGDGSDGRIKISFIDSISGSTSPAYHEERP